MSPGHCARSPNGFCGTGPPSRIPETKRKHLSPATSSRPWRVGMTWAWASLNSVTSATRKKATFPTLPRHERPADVTRPYSDNTLMANCLPRSADPGFGQIPETIMTPTLYSPNRPRTSGGSFYRCVFLPVSTAGSCPAGVSDPCRRDYNPAHACVKARRW